MKPTSALAVVIALAIAALADASIIQSNWNSSYAVGYSLFAPIGQSFTATANETQVGAVSFLRGAILDNPNRPDPVVTAQIRNGIGVTGAVIASQTLPAIPQSTAVGTWIDFVFDSPVTLTPGQNYTLTFTTPTNSGATALSYAGNHDNPYAGGNVIYGDGTSAAHEDLAFRVLSIPEPTSILLFLTALAGFISTVRRRW